MDERPTCVIEVGHPAGTPATWQDKSLLKFYVCDRHKAQYDERPDLGPFQWEAILDA